MDAAMRADLVRRVAAPRVGWDDAEDVVQEACLRAIRCYGAEALRYRRLMARIVARVAIDWRRLESRRRHVPLEPWHGMGDIERDALARVALDEALRLAERKPLALAVALGYSTAELARHQRVPLPRVKSQLHRDRVWLKESRMEEVDL